MPRRPAVGRLSFLGIIRDTAAVTGLGNEVASLQTDFESIRTELSQIRQLERLRQGNRQALRERMERLEAAVQRLQNVIEGGAAAGLHGRDREERGAGWAGSWRRSETRLSPTSWRVGRRWSRRPVGSLVPPYSRVRRWWASMHAKEGLGRWLGRLIEV